jgi:hypothetical protein
MLWNGFSYFQKLGFGQIRQSIVEREKGGVAIQSSLQSIPFMSLYPKTCPHETPCYALVCITPRNSPDAMCDAMGWTNHCQWYLLLAVPVISRFRSVTRRSHTVLDRGLGCFYMLLHRVVQRICLKWCCYTGVTMSQSNSFHGPMIMKQFRLPGDE